MMGCDRISELPEVLLTQILSYLPTKDSVRTSVLSKTWKFTWLRVPVLDLMVSNFPNHAKDFVSFIDNFLEYNKKSRMQKFKIYYDNYHGKRSMEWIGTTIDLGIQHLVVETYMDPSLRYFVPLNIYKSNTLVSLKLVTFGIHYPELVSLPCLKILHLENIWYDDFKFYHFGFDPLIMEKLISGCPVLEDLTLIKPIDYYNQDFLPFLRVRYQTLKIFRLTFENNGFGTITNVSVEIDAPRLEYMSFRDEQSDNIVVKNLSSLFMIDIDTEFNVEFGGSPLGPDDDLSKRDTIRDFLTGVSSVRHMIISQRTLEFLYRYPKLGPIPKFNNLFCLEAAFSRSILQLLPVFLEGCPNLKDLILDFVVSTEPEQAELTYVPQCLLSSLECLEIRELIMEEETGKKLVRYFLKNSIVLKKLILRFKDSSIANQDSDFFKELRTFTKRCRSCEVIIH